jgi:hypothetical protein
VERLIMSVNLDKSTAVAVQSGITPCACRDCMDVTVSGDVTKPELCSECTDAECEPYERPVYPGSSYDCQRDDAYGEA